MNKFVMAGILFGLISCGSNTSESPAASPGMNGGGSDATKEGPTPVAPPQITDPAKPVTPLQMPPLP